MKSVDFGLLALQKCRLLSQLSHLVFQLLVLLEQPLILLSQALVVDHQIEGLLLVQPGFLLQGLQLVLVGLIVLGTGRAGLLLFEVGNLPAGAA